METWKANHTHGIFPRQQNQLKIASTLAPVVVFDAIPRMDSSDPATSGSPAQATFSSPTSPIEQSPSRANDIDAHRGRQNASTASMYLLTEEEAQHMITSEAPNRKSLASAPGPPAQLRVSIAVDPEHYSEKLVKGKMHLTLVLTALLQLPDGCEAWVEQSRTELMSMDKGHLEGHFIKVLPLQIQENFLVVGFTLLAVPPRHTNPKLIAAFPALDGLIPWAETSVAIEHFNLGSSVSDDEFSRNQPVQHSKFSTPLIEISLLPDIGVKKSKHTVATLTVAVEEKLPRILLPKAIAEQRRVGPSFSQTYHGHTVRGTIVYGREHLYESPLAFTVPLKLLQCFADDERRVLEELEKEPGVSLSDMIQAVPLDHQPNPITRGASFIDTLRGNTSRINSAAKDQAQKMTRARQLGLSEEDSQLQKLLRQQISAHRNIEVYYQEMASKVEQRLRENMETGQGPFRRSTEKKEESAQWIPLNCCVQDFLVYDDGYETNYQSTTVGAAAAHSAGFARWGNSQTLSKAPPLGAYWNKQERGSDLLRDFQALQEVLASSSAEFSSILASAEDINGARTLALVKEIQFLNSEFVSFGDFLLSDYLTAHSTEGGAVFVCGEIRSIVKRLKQVDLAEDEVQEQDQTQHLFSTWLAKCKRSIREIVSCTQDLHSFVVIAIQHECLAVDATLVATPEWVMVKRTRECCLSQVTAALATSFLAVLEDWWTNMAAALQEQKAREQRGQDQHLPECKRFLHRDMGLISEESTNSVDGEVCPAQEEVPAIGSSRRSRNSIRRSGKGVPAQRPSLRSTASNSSSVSSLLGAQCGVDSSSRCKSLHRHPLEAIPQARAQNDLFWDQLISLGWLAQIGSLLSTQGNELGMLLDYAQAILDARESVTIGFHALPLSSAGLPTAAQATGAESTTTFPVDLDDIGDNSIQISGRRGQLTLSFGLDPLQFSLLPDNLKAGTSKIQVLPVLFSQGINEMQTISNLTGKSPVQRSINEDGLRHMQSYVLRYHVWHAQQKSQAKTQGIDETPPERPAGRSGRSFGPYAAWRSNANMSTASLISNMSSEWDMVSPSKAEIWDGEPLVAELLDHLETAVLGRLDETRPLFDSSKASVPGALDDQSIQLPQSDSEVPVNATRTETVSGSASGILNSMVEFGTSKLFSFKGSKDTSIVECAEALTRALGQIKTPADAEEIKPASSSSTPTQESRNDQRTSHASHQEIAHNCECFSQTSNSASVLPLTSLWVTSHLMSCKSAKDRTAMSVTLSQVNLLRACHGLQTGLEQTGGDEWQDILDAMRSEVGVRIKNVERNLKLGEFAKDLLWLSAFGSTVPPPAPKSTFDSTSCSNSEPYPADAITLVRSLLPGGGAKRRSMTLASELSGSIAEPTAQGMLPEDFAGDDDDNDFMGHSISTDSTQSEATSPEAIQFVSPMSLEPLLPPLKLVRSSTGPALAPVVTLDTNIGPDEEEAISSPRQSRYFPESPSHGSHPDYINILGVQPSSSPPQEHSQLPGEDQRYTSFPESFDEPVLAVRLARSLGLDSLGRPSSANAETSFGGQSAQQARSPPLAELLRRSSVLQHRSTPSWSSQQSTFFQQQQRLALTQSQKVPDLKRRLSSFGQGLGLLISKSTDTPAHAHSRHQSQSSSIDYSGLSQASPPPTPGRNTAGLDTPGSGSASVSHDGNGGSNNGGVANEVMVKRGKFAFNKMQLKFLPAAYRPPRRMASNIFET
ncbi:hypothetical protein EDD21DRAFT_443144 [Dissophora ornata]|nr:hypothetical protein EDD21DRAFT_443144 [Dissophora ornata]